MPKKSLGELFYEVTVPPTSNSSIFATDDLAIIAVVVSHNRPKTIEGMMILSNYLKRNWAIVATTTSPPQNNRMVIVYTLYKPIEF